MSEVSAQSAVVNEADFDTARGLGRGDLSAAVVARGQWSVVNDAWVVTPRYTDRGDLSLGRGAGS
jgi:hypothetical protein